MRGKTLCSQTSTLNAKSYQLPSVVTTLESLVFTCKDTRLNLWTVEPVTRAGVSCRLGRLQFHFVALSYGRPETMLRSARLRKELEMLNTQLPPGIVCNAANESMDQIEAVIFGTSGTPYEGGKFKISIQIPERYPFDAPRVKFQTPVYHPNIDSAGRICLDVLQMPPKGRWKPSLNLKAVLLSLQALLAQPNPDDPLVPHVAEQFKLSRELFNSQAAKHTRRHAT
ncbi:ubiquitin-conjugating enzyme E2 T [Ixodes scapularis]